MSQAELTRYHLKPGTYLLPLVVLVAVYLPTLYDLVIDLAADANYSHGIQIPIVSFYLIWIRRKELAATTMKSGPAGLVVIILGLVLFVAGTAAAEYFTARLSFVILLLGLTWYLFGGEIVRRTWFAFFFLCFMIPIPYVVYFAVAFPLQVAATKITVGVLSTIGMEVIRQGNIIHLAGGRALEVAEACSGIRSLIALFAIGAMWAYLFQKNLIGQIVLFLSTVPIAVFANVVRVLITVMIVATVTDKVTDEPLHTILGLSVFVVEFIGLFIIGSILRKVFR